MGDTITAEVIRAKHRWGDTCVLAARPARTGTLSDVLALPITIKVRDPGEEIAAGELYRWFGAWRDTKWGRQFHATDFCPSTPVMHGEDGIVAYLQKLPGIGPATASKLWRVYGSDAVRKLRESPEEVALAVGRPLTVDVAIAAAEQLEESAGAEDVMIDLVGLFTGGGFPRTLPKDCYKVWGRRATELIRRNPFLLTRFSGVGFLRADALYLSLGRPPQKLSRQLRCLIHAIETEDNGNTWLDVATLEKTLRQRIGSATPDPVRAIRLGVRANRLAHRRDKSGGLHLTTIERARDEQAIAEVIRDHRPACWPAIAHRSFDELTGHQCQTLTAATVGRIGILEGTPGTGKTFVAARLVDAVVDTYGQDSIAVMAPTGKAASRVGELLQGQGIDIVPTTIHRGLGARPAGGGWQFTYNAVNTLPHRFLVIDESSMIDTELMASLLRAAPDAHILFVGDPGQLPPVGHGRPFADLIAAGVPTGKLTEPHRNGGAIVQVCAAIRGGGPFTPCRSINLDAGHNLIAIPTSSPQGTIDQLLRFIDWVDDSETYNVCRDLQVIVGINDKTPISRKSLNGILQDRLNPASGASSATTAKNGGFRVGDKIICLKNHFAPDAFSADGRSLVCNGEIGTVIGTPHDAYALASFEAPDRDIKVFYKSADATQQFDLGYAITCHKSQGSEWPIVVIVLDSSFAASMVYSRTWLYTALSRAKTACVVIGDVGQAHRMIRRESLSFRKTFLVEEICR